MDLKSYLVPLIKYWWLLLLSVLVASLSSFFVTREQPPIYLARTTLLVSRTIYESPNPNTNNLWLAQQLASYYADLARRTPVRTATMQALGLEWLPEYTARPLTSIPFIEISVTDTSAVRAQAVANELANQLILQSPTSVASAAGQDSGFLAEELQWHEDQIKQTREDISEKEKLLAESNSAREIANLEQEKAALESRLSSLQSNYALMLANSNQGATNTLTLFEPANLPTTPIGPNKMMIIVLSAAIAGMLAAGAAYLLEYLDDTIKTPEEVTRYLDLPVIGYLSEQGKVQTGGVYVLQKPRSMVAESYRSLRTNLDFVSVDKPLRSILVTSGGVGEGKTSIALNLAIVMAQSGRRVLLLDADLRRPRLNHYLQMTNNVGISDVFRGQNLVDVMRPWGEAGITVITSGDAPPNPADLLGSQRMDSILTQLEQKFDVVIIDGPPSIVTDMAVLSAKVDGVLLVVRYGFMRRGSARKILEQFERAGARVVGVALNGMPRSQEEKYSRYGYYQGHYDAKERAKRPSLLAGNLLKLFQRGDENGKEPEHQEVKHL
jgi:succinoglycan biosynthesis transport protein ExoP